MISAHDFLLLSGKNAFCTQIPTGKIICSLLCIKFNSVELNSLSSRSILLHLIVNASDLIILIMCIHLCIPKREVNLFFVLYIVKVSIV